MNRVTTLVRRVTRRGDPALASEPALEPVYRALFLRELEKLGEPDDFYPVGGAANHSLLYLIVRLATVYRPRAVLDIGAGQSSRLWSTLRRHALVDDVTTVESDEGWAKAIGAQVDHPIVVTPLSRRQAAGRWHHSYDWSRTPGPFDVVVCDGPNGVPRHSRGGVLGLLDGALADEFALVLDDAERPGEQDTVGALHRALQARGIDYRVGVTRSAKTQVMFATGRFVAATYL